MTGRELLNGFIAMSSMDVHEVAKMLGVTPGAVGHWTCGRREVPSWVVRVIKLVMRNKITMKDWSEA